MKKMKCENCGMENPSDTKFCENCGNILAVDQPSAEISAPIAAPEAAEIECPVCKQPNKAGAKYCDSCGAGLQTPVSTEPESQVETPATAAPVEVAAPITNKVLVLPDESEIDANIKKTFGRLELAKLASEPMWISRQHFTILEEDSVTYIQDEGSSNGTKLNGTEIKGAGKQPLKNGDEIMVGDALKLVFKIK